MHQRHWVKVGVATLDEALVAFTEHVDRLGDRQTWWRWVVARLPDGSVIDRPLEPTELDEFHPDDLARRPAELAAAKLAFRDPGQWLAGAWVEAWTQLGLQGLQPVRLGAETELERATIDVLLALPPDQIARRFLEATLASLRESYARFSFDAYGAETIEGSLRVVRAIAFERVWTTVLDEFDAPSLPFMRDQSPDDWPAHLIGDRNGPFVLLLVDMHL